MDYDAERADRRLSSALWPSHSPGRRKGGHTVTVTDDEPPFFFTLRTASARCGVSKDVLEEAVRAGRLRGKRTGANGGGLYLFSRAQLDAWFEGLEDA